MLQFRLRATSIAFCCTAPAMGSAWYGMPDCQYAIWLRAVSRLLPTLKLVVPNRKETDPESKREKRLLPDTCPIQARTVLSQEEISPVRDREYTVTDNKTFRKLVICILSQPVLVYICIPVLKLNDWVVSRDGARNTGSGLDRQGNMNKLIGDVTFECVSVTIAQ
nr:hypothetical protein CFP56_24651 [Quercus suber]